MAYRQTITDLYSGARTRINDLDNYVTGDLLEQERINVQQGLGQGIRSEPQGAQLVLQAADPERVALEGDEPTVVLTACIDGTAVTDILPDGGSRPGVRERLYYRVVRTAYLPGPGWAVAEVTAEADAKDRAC